MSYSIAVMVFCCFCRRHDHGWGRCLEKIVTWQKEILKKEIEPGYLLEWLVYH
jgi:hypothetical protein